MKSKLGVEGVYWVMTGGASIGLCIIKQRAPLNQEFLGDEGTECTCWMQKPQLTIFRVAVLADLATRRQIPAPQSSKSEE